MVALLVMSLREQDVCLRAVSYEARKQSLENTHQCRAELCHLLFPRQCGPRRPCRTGSAGVSLQTAWRVCAVCGYMRGGWRYWNGRDRCGLSGSERGTNKDSVWAIKGADCDTQIANGKVRFRNVPPMPEARAATAEYRITEPLIDGFHGPLSALVKSQLRRRLALLA